MSIVDAAARTSVNLSQPGWVKSDAAPLWAWTNSGDSQELLRRALDNSLETGWLADLTGHWGIVDGRPSEPVIAVDRMRSRPLFVRREGRSWIITDTVEEFRHLSSFQLDEVAAHAFAHMAFVPGAFTLIDRVQTVSAGHRATLTDTGIVQDAYETMSFADARLQDEAEFESAFTGAMDTVFERMLSSFRGRKFLVPLSGGLDSRLVLAWLKRMGETNVEAFTYGLPGGESAIAEEVARQLGTPFTFVEYEPREVAAAWKTQSGEFMRYAWSGNSLPHVQDWFALKKLKELGKINRHTVVLPGHTIVGNLHDEQLLHSTPGPAQVARTVARYHGKILGKSDQLSANPYFQKAIKATLTQVGFDGSPSTVQSAIEAFNLLERQAKYINNSLRTYEHFGAAWAVPMLDKEMWRVWFSGSEELTKDRDWYARFVDKHSREMGADGIATHDIRSAGTKAFVGSALGRGLAQSKVAPFLTNIRKTWIWRQHPEALQSFWLDVPPIERALRILGGTEPIGLWAESFIRGTWGDGTQVPPTRD